MYLYGYVYIMMCCCVMRLLALVFATMQQVNKALISLCSCKHYDGLTSHISPIGVLHSLLFCNYLIYIMQLHM